MGVARAARHKLPLQLLRPLASRGCRLPQRVARLCHSSALSRDSRQVGVSRRPPLSGSGGPARHEALALRAERADAEAEADGHRSAGCADGARAVKPFSCRRGGCAPGALSARPPGWTQLRSWRRVAPASVSSRVDARSTARAQLTATLAQRESELADVREELRAARELHARQARARPHHRAPARWRPAAAAQLAQPRRLRRLRAARGPLTRAPPGRSRRTQRTQAGQWEEKQRDVLAEAGADTGVVVMEVTAVEGVLVTLDHLHISAADFHYGQPHGSATGLVGIPLRNRL